MIPSVKTKYADTQQDATTFSLQHDHVRGSHVQKYAKTAVLSAGGGGGGVKQRILHLVPGQLVVSVRVGHRAFRGERVNRHLKNGKQTSKQAGKEASERAPTDKRDAKRQHGTSTFD